MAKHCTISKRMNGSAFIKCHFTRKPLNKPINKFYFLYDNRSELDGQCLLYYL